MESVLREDVTEWGLYFAKEEKDLFTGDVRTYELCPGGADIPVTQVGVES